MGLGTQKNSNKAYFLKIVTKDENKKQISPVFSVTEKVGDKWEQTRTATEVTGNLVAVLLEKKEWEDNEYDVIKLSLQDAETDELFVLDLRFNLLSRSIINSFLGMKEYTNVSVSLYQKKDSNYPAVSVKQNGERASWAFSIEELPKVEKVKVGKKEVVDSTELDEFLLGKLKELAERVKASLGKPATRGSASSDTETEDKTEAAPTSKPKSGKKKTPPPQTSGDEDDAGVTADDIPF